MGTRLARTPRSRCHPQMGRRHRLARPPPHKPPPKQLGLTLHQLFLSFNPTAPALSSHHYPQRQRHLGQPGAALAIPCTSPASSSPCGQAPPSPPSAAVERRPSRTQNKNPACHPKRADKRGISLSALDGAGGVNHGPPRAGNRHAVNPLGTNALRECSRQT